MGHVISSSYYFFPHALLIINDQQTSNSLDGNNLNSQGASVLFDFLGSSNMGIKKLSVAYNEDLNDKCMNSLGKCIQSNKSIENISLAGNEITSKGVKILAPYLEGNTTLKLIEFYENAITDKAIPWLISMIESSHLEYLSIADTAITRTNALVIPIAHNVIRYRSIKLSLPTELVLFIACPCFC